MSSSESPPEEPIVAHAAIQSVHARAAVKRVVACVALGDVIAAVAYQGVIAVAVEELLPAQTTLQCVSPMFPTAI